MFHFKNIGGDSHVVHVDETTVVKLKYNKGKLLSKEDYWVVGGIDTTTKEAFMNIILKINHETLKTVLGTWIKKDSIIYTDEWKAYKKVCEEL